MFYGAHTLWNKTPLHIKSKFIAYGSTDAGLWFNLCKYTGEHNSCFWCHVLSSHASYRLTVLPLLPVASPSSLQLLSHLYLHHLIAYDPRTTVPLPFCLHLFVVYLSVLSGFVPISPPSWTSDSRFLPYEVLSITILDTGITSSISCVY